MSVSQNFPTIEPSLNLSFANTKVLDPRITFSRPTDAVYYDGQTVSKAEENLLLRSQEFDISWIKDSVSTTANTTVAPDGTTTADTLAFVDTAVSRVYQTFTGNGSSFTFSVFAKYIDKQWIALRLTDSGGTSRFAWFDIQNGVVGTTDTGITASIVASTEGFYRCIATIATTATSNFAIIYGVNGDGSTSNVGQTGSIAAWGAQLEARDTVTAYTPTTTQAITNYIPTLLTAPANTARFDHNPVTGESLGLLVEEQRTNLLTYSEEFDNAAWTKFNATITANTIIAPDGTLTGSKISSTTGTWSSGLAVGTVSVASSSISIYAKAGEAPILQLATYTYGNFQCYFDLTTGVSNGTVGFTRTMTDVGNGWWRCTVSGTLTVGGAFIFIPMAVNSGLNPAPIGQGIYIWGAQLEAGAFPTSYIKTQASQVTRSADSASMTGTNFSDWYRQDEGTVYVESKATLPTSGAITTFLSKDITNYINTGQYTSTLSRAGYVVTNNTDQANIQFAALSSGTFNKFALAFQTNNIAGTINAQTVVTDTNCLIPNVTSLTIGKNITNTQYLNGTIKRISYYPQRLSNENLQALTS